MAVRICTIGVAQFKHHGLVVGTGWTPVDKTLPDAARAALRDFHGKFVRVHPEDVTKLGELGLAFKGPNKPLDAVKAVGKKD